MVLYTESMTMGVLRTLYLNLKVVGSPVGATAGRARIQRD